MNRIEAIKYYYEPKLDNNKEDYVILGWESTSAQEARYQVLLEHFELEGKSILDVGCGLGNLLDYIQNAELNVNYTGVDILEHMIKKARSRNPSSNFVVGDIFSQSVLHKGVFDIIFSSGLFNLNMGNNLEFLPIAVKKLLDLSKEAVVVNMLHKKSRDQEESYFYYHPEEVFDIIQPVLPVNATIQLIEEYLPNDFTVIIKKNSD